MPKLRRFRLVWENEGAHADVDTDEARSTAAELLNVLQRRFGLSFEYETNVDTLTPRTARHLLHQAHLTRQFARQAEPLLQLVAGGTAVNRDTPWGRLYFCDGDNAIFRRIMTILLGPFAPQTPYNETDLLPPAPAPALPPPPRLRRRLPAPAAAVEEEEEEEEEADN